MTRHIEKKKESIHPLPRRHIRTARSANRMVSRATWSPHLVVAEPQVVPQQTYDRARCGHCVRISVEAGQSRLERARTVPLGREQEAGAGRRARSVPTAGALLTSPGAPLHNLRFCKVVV